METKQYAEALKDRLSPQMFEPAPGRLMWLAVHGSIAAAGLDGECLGVR